jgi:hypothetical protein
VIVVARDQSLDFKLVRTNLGMNCLGKKPKKGDIIPAAKPQPVVGEDPVIVPVVVGDSVLNDIGKRVVVPTVC